MLKCKIKEKVLNDVRTDKREERQENLMFVYPCIII